MPILGYIAYPSKGLRQAVPSTIESWLMLLAQSRGLFPSTHSLILMPLNLMKATLKKKMKTLLFSLNRPQGWFSLQVSMSICVSIWVFVHSDGNRNRESSRLLVKELIAQIENHSTKNPFWEGKFSTYFCVFKIWVSLWVCLGEPVYFA